MLIIRLSGFYHFTVILNCQKPNIFLHCDTSSIMDKLVILTIAAIAMVAVAGATVIAVGEKDDCVSTTVILEDGIRCTIDGKTVSDGDQICVKSLNGNLNIHLESDYAGMFLVNGMWDSDNGKTTASKASGSSVKSCDVTVGFGHGKYCGDMYVGIAYPGADDDVQLKLTVLFNKERFTVSYDGKQVQYLDEVQCTTNYNVFTADSITGEKEIYYDAMWFGSDGHAQGWVKNHVHGTSAEIILHWLGSPETPYTGTLKVWD